MTHRTSRPTHTCLVVSFFSHYFSSAVHAVLFSPHDTQMCRLLYTGIFLPATIPTPFTVCPQICGRPEATWLILFSVSPICRRSMHGHVSLYAHPPASGGPFQTERPATAGHICLHYTPSHHMVKDIRKYPRCSHTEAAASHSGEKPLVGIKPCCLEKLPVWTKEGNAMQGG